MKVLFPENISDITLQQFQEYNKILEEELSEFELRKQTISIFTNLDYEQVDSIVQTDIEDSYNQIIKALNQEVDFKDRFTMNDVEFGFIPNLDLVTGAEWVDISKYQSDIDKYHRLMAVLFRPVKKSNRKGEYKIVKYQGTSEYAEQMKQMPMHIVNGALVFFYNLAKELESNTLKFIAKEQVRVNQHLTTLKNGDGTQPLST